MFAKVISHLKQVTDAHKQAAKFDGRSWRLVLKKSFCFTLKIFG